MNTQISIVEEPRPWIRLYTEFATDPIIQSLAFEDQRHFVMVLLMKGSAILDRRLEPEVRDRIIRKTLGLDIETAEAAKTRLMSMNLINESWQPLSWDKRQFEGDFSKNRMRKLRETSQDRHMAVTVTPPDTDTDTDTDLVSSSQARSASIGKPILSAAADAPPAKASPKDKTNPCPYEEIRQLWLDTFPTLASPVEVERWSATRKNRMRTHWKDHPSLTWWQGFFEYLKESDFLMGRRKDFQITMDWLLVPANFIKCQEGNYDNA